MHEQAHQVNVWKVFGLLVGLTLIELGVASLEIARGLLIILLVGSALVKAGLVAFYFMHLKFEGRLIWCMLILTTLLGIAFVLVLFPDVAIGYWP